MQIKKIVSLLRACIILIFWQMPYAYCQDVGDILEAQMGGPNPLFSIGHNVQKKHHGMLRSTSFYEERDQSQSLFVSYNGIFYGITDNFTMYARLPCVRERKTSNLKSTGIGNLQIQGEWAFYNERVDDSFNQVTVLAAIRLPTSTVEFPGLDTFKATNFLFGLTTSNWSEKWHLYSDCGYLVFTTHQHFKLGNAFVYNLGLGRIIGSRPLKDDGILYFELIADMNGLYEQPSILDKKDVFKTGGHVLFVGPTFRFSVPSFVLLGGLQYPISQRIKNPLFTKTNYKMGISLSWLF